MLGVEDVGCRRVVDDDGVLQVTSDLREVFDVVSLVVVAALAEQAVVDNLVDVELIKEGIAILLELGQYVLDGKTATGRVKYLRDGGCEDDNLVELAHPLHELIHSRPLDNIDVVVVALYLHWNREVGLVEDLYSVSS